MQSYVLVRIFVLTLCLVGFCHNASARFIQADPIGMQDGPNTYSYVHNNPTNWTDPLGLRTSYCFRPLGDYTGKNGRGGAVFNHQFVCVTLPDGTVKCDSTNNPDNDSNPLTPAPGQASLPGRDNEKTGQCYQIDDDKDRCIEDCMLKRWTQPRPNYAIGPLGTDCQEYSWDLVVECRRKCR